MGWRKQPTKSLGDGKCGNKHKKSASRNDDERAGFGDPLWTTCDSQPQRILFTGCFRHAASLISRFSVATDLHASWTKVGGVWRGRLSWVRMCQPNKFPPLWRRFQNETRRFFGDLAGRLRPGVGRR